MKFKAKFLKEHKKLHAANKLYGTTTMGARGQVVIPALARRELRLKPGDQLLVIGKFNRALGLIKADQLGELTNMIMDHVSGSPAESMVKDQLKKLFGKIKS